MSSRSSAARCLLLSACLLALWAGPAQADFVVVRNAKNTTAKLAKDAVKGVFSGRTKTWPGGETIILVIGSEDSPAMSWLASAIFGVSTKTFLAKIKQDVFKGDVPRPLSANDDAATIKKVQSGAGVVGVVTDAAARSLPADVVRVAVE
jgi:hypothetical protein